MENYFTFFWNSILWPLLTFLIPVIVTFITVNSRIRNENREKHKPYLNLKNIDNIEKIDKENYYLVFGGRNFNSVHDNLFADFKLKENEKEIFLNMELENIGYGVASNIKFYNLLNGSQIYGTQKNNENKNQKLFTTFDIASSASKSVEVVLYSSILNEDNILIEDHARILCVYQDLNDNIYNFIISINVKSTGHYDYFSYQPSSKSYKKWILENKSEYKNIIKKYKEF